MDPKNDTAYKDIFFFFIAIPLLIGVISGFLTKDANEEFTLTAVQPSFTPPGWLFPVVWTILYILMGISIYIISEDKYKDKIEWLEIENIGTKRIVRVEERKIPNEKKIETPRNIIAKKKGVIKKVIAKKGDIVKDMDDYVEKGELIITGDLIFNNESKGKVRADGEVYAEIWYITNTKYPIVIEKEKLTGRKKNIYVINFLNKVFELTLDKYKTKKIKEKTILKHNFLPITISRQTQRETKKISKILTYDEALENAKEASIKYIKNKLNKKEYIIRSNYLKSNLNNSTIEVEMFFAVYEDITDYAEIG